MIHADAKLANLSPHLKLDVMQYLETKPYGYEKVYGADLNNIWDAAKVRGLILHLGAKGWALGPISNAACAPATWCRKTLENARKDNQKIRTTNWEAL